MNIRKIIEQGNLFVENMWMKRKKAKHSDHMNGKGTKHDQKNLYYHCKLVVTTSNYPMSEKN
jgi:hypothetical protein